jgi:hypothetical protein
VRPRRAREPLLESTLRLTGHGVSLAFQWLLISTVKGRPEASIADPAAEAAGVQTR